MKNLLNKPEVNQFSKLLLAIIFSVCFFGKVSAQTNDTIAKKKITEPDYKIFHSKKTVSTESKNPTDSMKQKADSLLLANGWYPNQDSYDFINSKFHCGNNQDSIYCAAQSFFNNLTIENNINQYDIDRDYEKALKLKNKMGKQLFDNCHATDSNIHIFLSNHHVLQFNNSEVTDSVHKELDLLKLSMAHLSKLINKMWIDTLTISGNSTNLLNDDMKEINIAYNAIHDTLTSVDLENLFILKVYIEEITGIMQQVLKNAKLKIGFYQSEKITGYSSLCNFIPLDNYPKAIIQNKSENELMVNVRTIDSTAASRDGYYAFYLPRSAYILKRTDKTQRFSKTTCKALEPFAFGARYYLWVEDRDKKILAPAQEFEIKANDILSETDKTPLMIIQIMIK